MGRPPECKTLPDARRGLGWGHAEIACAIPADWRSSLCNVQLLPKATSSGAGERTRPVRAISRGNAAAIRLHCQRVRRDARACALAGQRASEGSSGQSPAGLEAISGGAATRAPILAGALLRFQCVHCAQAHREAAIYAPQSGQARPGGSAGAVGVVELSPLRDRRDRDGRNRIAVDGNAAGPCAASTHVSNARCGAPSP